MSTVIYPSPIFGPVISRRLGVSLGINLLPADGKFCSFDCVYCECGLNAWHRPKQPLPTPAQVHDALEAQLIAMGERGQVPDVLTFAGNGEPTLHPAFADIAADVRTLRDKYFPRAQMSILSNATQVHRPEIHRALLLFDKNIQKLDTISEEYIRRVDRPTGHYDVERTVEALAAFKGKVIIQTMFMRGEVDGQSVTNTGLEYVEPWAATVAHILPSEVMIYTIDRETPYSTLHKASHEELDGIAQRVRALGIDCGVSY